MDALSIPQKRFYAYLITNKISGKKYVGITGRTIEIRWRQHVNNAYRGDTSQRALYKAIVKYGVEAFIVEHVASGFSWQSLCEIEQKLILQYATYGTKGYNLTKGGEGSQGRPISEKLKKYLKDRTFSQETREKLRSSKIGFKHTLESRAKISAVQKGRKQSKSSIEKRSAALRGRKRSIEFCVHMKTARVGYKHSAEVRDKMSSMQVGKRKGVSQTLEHIEKRIASRLANK